MIEVKVQTEATEFYAALMRRWKHQDTPEQLRVDNNIDADRKSSGGSIDLAEREVDQALSEKVRGRTVFFCACVATEALCVLWSY